MGVRLGYATDARGGVGNHSASRAFALPLGRVLAALLLLALSVLNVTPSLAQSASVGSVVRNVATVDYTAGSLARSVATNEVTLRVEPAPSRATIALARFVGPSGNGEFTSTAGPTQCAGASGLVTLAAPVVAGSGPIDPLQPSALSQTQALHGGDALFVRVADADQNRDATALETVDVRVIARATGDSERIRLTESSPNSGVFVGYIPTAVAVATIGNCVLELARDSEVEVSYVDPVDASDAVLAAGLVDPFGLVFDSATGTAVNGARVRLIDATTGQPARVFGDDGVSTYPSEMITGELVTDSGGTVYDLPDGVYRFPLVASGNYRLEVEPPGGYLFASSVAIDALQRLPGAPFRLSDGSFGRPFAVNAPVVAIVDVPLDPGGDSLVLRKTASQDSVAPGDFVLYELTVENTSRVGAFRNLRIEDRLPVGLRFRAGSARRDGATVADPALSADGRTMTFDVGTLTAGQRARIRYVVEVTVAARGPELVNTAIARAPGGSASNEARAVVRLAAELFSDRGFIVGRISEGECGVLDGAGVAGVRVYLEDGRYAVTDAEGKYHFEGVDPGTHVVQIDDYTIPEHLELGGCRDTVRHAGRAYSQFVDLRAGALWRADFQLAARPAPAGEVSLAMRSVLASASLAQHDVALRTRGGVPLTNARLIVMLPAGMGADLAQVSFDGVPLRGAALDGSVLTIPLSTLGVAAEHRVRFTSRAGTAMGELPVKAVLLFDTPAASAQRSAVVENKLSRGAPRYAVGRYTFSPKFDVLETTLRGADRLELDRIAAEWRGARGLTISGVGHTDKTPISVRNQARFADNYALSAARARSVVEYLARQLGVPEEALRIEGVGPDEPLALGDDPGSLAMNRRVEIAISGARFAGEAPLALVTAAAEASAVTTRGAVPRADTAAPVIPTAGRSGAATAAADAFGALDVEQLDGSVRWLAPEENAVQAIASARLAIAHGPTQNATLLLGGREVPRLNFDGVSTNRARTAALSRWRGVDLVDGANEFVVVIRNEDGSEAARLTRVVHYGGGAVRAEFDRGNSVLVADGRRRPVIALRLFDAHGKPARPGTLGAFRVDAPYRSWWEVQALDDNPLLATGAREPTFEVGADGVARIELEPTSQTGMVTLRVRFNDRQSQEVRAWLMPEPRPWIMVGLAEGTAAWRDVSRAVQPLPGEAPIEEGYQGDGRIAFFAKGRVRGDLLLTLAYDSARDPKLARERLRGVIEPDRYYLVYGDGTEQRFEAASTERVFLKLERREFVALFGDYDTGLTVTELTRYSRSLTGIKADFGGERVTATGFAARSDLGFVRDELRGDGTSGLYRLTRQRLVINSDKIRLEVRDRFRSERVLETRELARFLDYRIDYSDGSLFFREPVPSRDPNLNPIYIVAEYETQGTGEEVTSAGGRAAARTADGTIEVGVSAIHDGALDGDARVAGVDLRWRATPITEVRAEAAYSDSDNLTRPGSGTAWLAEVKHVSEKLDLVAYAREQDARFGIGQQAASEAGTRKVGADVRWNIDERWAVQSQALLQQQTETGAERRLGSAELRHTTADSTIAVGLRSVEDEDGRGASLRSDQAYLTSSVDLFEDRVTLRATGDMTMGGRDGSSDYPARALLGVDYRLAPETTLFAEWEHADGAQLASDMTRVGLRARPWERTQIVTAVSQQASEFGPRTFANFGLTQGWRLSERWTLDLGIDQSNTLRGPDLAPLNPNVPLASGSTTEDFFASFVGAQYHADLWTATARAERRTSDNEIRQTLLAGWYREPALGHALSLSVLGTDSDARSSGADTTAADVRFAWAYRPATGRWIIFNRTDFKRDTREDALLAAESTRWVQNAHLHLQWNPVTQLGLQLGARHVVSTFDDERYSGVSSLFGVDLRRDLPWRPFGRALDVGLHGAWLNSWESGVGEHQVGFDVGVTLATNVWVSIGYNVAGFRDEDFAAARYTDQGPFLRLRIKADQDSFRDLRLDSLRPSR
jgi:uncharacterized repeat protein (TIGR01451 family)